MTWPDPVESLNTLSGALSQVTNGMSVPENTQAEAAGPLSAQKADLQPGGRSMLTLWLIKRRAAIAAKPAG